MEPEKTRAPNIRDVARLAGVSYQTVSRVLNDSPSIRESTKQRVLEVIQQVGYRPNQAARALVTSRSTMIGVLASQSGHYGPATSLTAIEQAAREAGYRLSITTLPATDRESIRTAVDYLLSQSVEALVVIAPQGRVVEVLGELSITVPFVTLSAPKIGDERGLSVDQVSGGWLAARHLIELGHTEILHIRGPHDWIEAEARAQGFMAELVSAGLVAREPVVGDWTAQSGYRAGRALLDARDFTAVFVGNDQMALGFAHACREAGLSIPGDVSIVGFDDIPEAAHFWPPLTTVRQNFSEIGRRAVSLVLGELRGEEHLNHDQVLPELIVRESTRSV